MESRTLNGKMFYQSNKSILKNYQCSVKDTAHCPLLTSETQSDETHLSEDPELETFLSSEDGDKQKNTLVMTLSTFLIPGDVCPREEMDSSESVRWLSG